MDGRSTEASDMSSIYPSMSGIKSVAPVRCSPDSCKLQVQGRALVRISRPLPVLFTSADRDQSLYIIYIIDQSRHNGLVT